MLPFAGTCTGAFDAGALAITVSSNWGTTSTASPATAPNRTLTVPSGNAGNLRFDLFVVPTGTIEYRKNSGTYTSFVDDDVVNFANGDTLNFKLTGASDQATIRVYDTQTGVQVGTCILMTS